MTAPHTTSDRGQSYDEELHDVENEGNEVSHRVLRVVTTAIRQHPHTLAALSANRAYPVRHNHSEQEQVCDKDKNEEGELERCQVGVNQPIGEDDGKPLQHHHLHKRRSPVREAQPAAHTPTLELTISHQYKFGLSARTHVTQGEDSRRQWCRTEKPRTSRIQHAKREEIPPVVLVPAYHAKDDVAKE